MEYIINPSWFYWISIVDSIRGIAIGYSILFAITMFVLLMFIWFEEHCKVSESAKKIIFCSIIGCIISVLALVFVPTKETLIEIQVAKLATYDNVAMTVDGIKSVTDYIIEAIQTINGG